MFGMPPWTVALGFVLGAIAGSFLNMAIYRLPRAISFINPSSSICPNCKHPLAWRDLMPIVSWLSTKGKCRYCEVPISSRYMWVEILTGLLFAGVWYQYLVATDQPTLAWFYMVAVAALVAVIFIDWELYIIPDELNAFILVIGIALQFALGTPMVALWGALAGWGVLWGITFLGRIAFGKDAMGHGDIKMMRGVGAIVGPMLMVASVMIAVVVGLVVGLMQIYLAKRSAVPEAAEEGEDDGGWEPEPIASVIKLGIWYLLCLDVVAIFFPKMYQWIGEPVPEKGLDEDDEWVPSATTIPFGPYLATGAILCMLFAGPIEKGMRDYWRNATGGDAEVSIQVGSGRTL